MVTKNLKDSYFVLDPDDLKIEQRALLLASVLKEHLYQTATQPEEARGP